MQIPSAALSLQWFPISLKRKSSNLVKSAEPTVTWLRPSSSPIPTPTLALFPSLPVYSFPGPLASSLFFGKCACPSILTKPNLISLPRKLLPPFTCLDSIHTLGPKLNSTSSDKSVLTHQMRIHLPFYVFLEISEVSLSGT